MITSHKKAILENLNKQQFNEWGGKPKELRVMPEFLKMDGCWQNKKAKQTSSQSYGWSSTGTKSHKITRFPCFLFIN